MGARRRPTSAAPAVRLGCPTPGPCALPPAWARAALLIDVRKARLRVYVEDDVYAALPPEVAQPG
eukprot:6849840-Alexandrium_andersonii.AAC.1